MIDDDEPILEKAIGTNIEWLPGKCLPQKILKRKPKKGSKNAKPITKTENYESFFNFFNPPHRCLRMRMISMKRGEGGNTLFDADSSSFYLGDERLLSRGKKQR